MLHHTCQPEKLKLYCNCVSVLMNNVAFVPGPCSGSMPSMMQNSSVHLQVPLPPLFLLKTLPEAGVSLGRSLKHFVLQVFFTSFLVWGSVQFTLNSSVTVQQLLFQFEQLKTVVGSGRSEEPTDSAVAD